MNSLKTGGWLLAVALGLGCNTLRDKASMPNAEQIAGAPASSAPEPFNARADRARNPAVAVSQEKTEVATNPVSLNAATSIQNATQTFDRKIIQNAELNLELDDPNTAQRQLSAIADAHGGFVVTSEARQQSASAASANTTVNVVLRVPAAQFNAAIEKIRGLGGRILLEKRTGQDVTEEYIDLEARVRTQKALEAQMLDILKRAGRISDALEVQNQIATVRTEIERLEGRQRFLANQAALSTINVTLHTPAPVVITTTAHGFWHQIKQAFGDGIDLASNITLGIIQFVITLIPILLLIVLPLWLLWRLVRPHVNGAKKIAPAVSPNETTPES